MADIKEEYVETIRQLVPIFSLSPQYQNELIQRAGIIELRKGKYLFKQGDRDEYSFYLLDGELDMESDGQVQSTIRGGSDSARYPLAQLQPRQFSARAKAASRVLQVSRNALDKLLVMEQDSSTQDGGMDVEVSDLGGDGEDVDWMTRVLQSELFSRLPTANIHQLFTVLEAVEFAGGDVVITQGEPGDYYYIIQEGTCEVFCRSSDGKGEIQLAELKPGDGFGEEALLADATRNASVRMLSDGVLMRMNKDNFLELIKKPALEVVTYDEACERVNNGAELIDVRLAEEYQQSHIENSRNVPLAVLRTDTSQLPPGKEYIVYCDSGGRSSVAAFLLTQRSCQVSYIDGGLIACPSSDMRQGAAKSAGESEANKQAEPTGSEKLIDADVRASGYEAEVAVSEQQLQEAERRPASAGDDADKRDEYEAMAKKLREEHARLQAAKERAAAEAQRMREEEEQRIKKLREDAERELQEQKKKLEQVYAQNAREMEKLKAMKQKAEQQVKSARQKAEQESSEAQRRMQEADAIKKQLKEAKLAIEQEAETQRNKQADMEKKIQQEAMRKLEAERKNLADQYQRSSEALESAQKEKAAAEAARKAAQEEAQSIIAEFKEAHAKARAEEEAKLQAERERLEKESRELRESMAAASKAKEDAEAARRASEAQLVKLKIKLAKGEGKKDETLRDQIKAAEAEASAARDELAQAEKTQQAAQAAHASSVRELEQQSEEEKRLREQIEAEVSEWLNENELEEPSEEELKKQAEHLQRIKERAEQAKHESKKAAQSLMDDISSQLGSD